MAQSRFSLSWEAYKKNICNGLGYLQQNGEFVDMTLAADGHFVKVHQLVIALASPYFKQLLSSIQCPHPVIFLNKISYTTLSFILEYIYTGEVLVSIEHLNELLEAGKELHIKGLEDMDLQEQPRHQKTDHDSSNVETMEDEICYFEVSEQKTEDVKPYDQNVSDLEMHCVEDNTDETYEDIQETKTDSIRNKRIVKLSDSKNADTPRKYKKYAQKYKKEWELQPEFSGWLEKCENKPCFAFCKSCNKQINISSGLPSLKKHAASKIHEVNSKSVAVKPDMIDSVNEKIAQFKQREEMGMMQYTVSNQGSLQMVLNRFMYYLKHTNKNNTRQWRCVDYVSSKKCPAIVVTKNDVVLQRISVHTHPFHDGKILKKVKRGAVFSAIQDAEREGSSIKTKSKQDDDQIDSA